MAEWTTEQVRRRASRYRTDPAAASANAERFDAWLAAHDAEVRAQALKGAADCILEKARLAREAALYHFDGPYDEVCCTCFRPVDDGWDSEENESWPCPTVRLCDEVDAEMGAEQ